MAILSRVLAERLEHSHFFYLGSHSETGKRQGRVEQKNEWNLEEQEWGSCGGEGGVGAGNSYLCQVLFSFSAASPFTFSPQTCTCEIARSIMERRLEEEYGDLNPFSSLKPPEQLWGPPEQLSDLICHTTCSFSFNFSTGNVPYPMNVDLKCTIKGALHNSKNKNRSLREVKLFFFTSCGARCILIHCHFKKWVLVFFTPQMFGNHL